jgi:uncharacterized protein YbbC (DUF1343 family)/CubicO group peptidase (beta-lactamase class C family)
MGHLAPGALAAAILLVTAAGVPAAGQLAITDPARGPASPALAGRVRTLVDDAIAQRQMPGAVVIAGHRDRVAVREAMGARATTPAVEPMTLDTIFDAASLTKVVVTTTAIMQLVEDGRLRLTDPVWRHLPGFERHGKRDITVRHLLSHSSGLRPDVDLVDPWLGAEHAMALAFDEVPLARVDERVIYSDINFFVLGRIVEVVAGLPLDRYAVERIFAPLRMSDSGFRPGPGLVGRIAPTERCPANEACVPALPGAAGPAAPPMLRGVVHDPTARRMGGVAGHAGLFTTADDLARFARMLLHQGTLDGARVLSPLSVARTIAPSTPAHDPNVRGLGWDLDSSFSSNRGELFPLGSFGHTGFTGTSLWIDPATATWVVVLSSRVHPEGKGDAVPLRARLSTLVAAALVDAAPPAAAAPRVPKPAARPVPPARAPTAPRVPVLTGIDVLRAEGFARLAGKKVALLTNHTGAARDGASTIDLLHAAKNLTLVALFSPEHGIRGTLDETVPSGRDEKTGLAIHSLYGETRRPTDAMLAGVDTIVVDLQDVGVRFYTYATTVALVMEEAARRKIPVVVLDRPNPIGGWQIEGSFTDEASLGFTSYLPMPIRHGLTLGELAQLFNGERKIGADLSVVRMPQWRRDWWFDDTGVPWINPSPNMRSVTEATLYPGLGMIEASNVSVGRGTDTPFERIGAPWIDGVALAAAINARGIAGVRVYPIRFTPASSKYANEACGGIAFVVTDREALRPAALGVEIASALARLYPAHYTLNAADRLVGSRRTVTRVLSGEDPAAIAASWQSDEATWRRVRAKYLIYTPE